MRSKIRRLQELYSSGGLLEVAHGISGYLLTSSTSKRGRAKITEILGGEPVWSKEWDILCVLDGCRADLFEEVVEDSETITSVGATSRTWVKRTFDSCDSPESVGYITGNPFYTQVDVDDLGYFHAQNVEEMRYGIETVPPEKLAERAIEVWRRRGEIGINKLIIHFMQPHAPFRSRPEWFEQTIGKSSWSANIWKRLSNGEFTQEEVWKVYKDNLDWVMEDGVSSILSNCDGQIAMTADHGNAMGEWGFYGHPLGCPVSAVRRVPWKVTEGTDEMSIQPETKSASERVDLQDQLRALGYK